MLQHLAGFGGPEASIQVGIATLNLNQLLQLSASTARLNTFDLFAELECRNPLQNQVYTIKHL